MPPARGDHPVHRSPSSSLSDEEHDEVDALYPDDMLSRMFGMVSAPPHRQTAAVDEDIDEPATERPDDAPQTWFGRMFERTRAPDDDDDEQAHKPEAFEYATTSYASTGDDPRLHDDHILYRMFETSSDATTAPPAPPTALDGTIESGGEGEGVVGGATGASSTTAHTTTDGASSTVPTMSIIETHEDALRSIPLCSRMFDVHTEAERNQISQYEFQSIIREIVSVRHAIRDHVIQLRHLRTLHRKHEETLHAMLQQVQQDGVRSCDYPLLFYMSRRTKRRVNKHVHQSEHLQTFMTSRGIHMSDVERKDLINLIKKESYIRNSEGIIRSVPIDGN